MVSVPTGMFWGRARGAGVCLEPLETAEVRPGAVLQKASLLQSPAQEAFARGVAASAPGRPQDSCLSNSLGGAQDHSAPGPGLIPSWHLGLLNISGWKVPSLLFPPLTLGTCSQEPIC